MKINGYLIGLSILMWFTVASNLADYYILKVEPTISFNLEGLTAAILGIVFLGMAFKNEKTKTKEKKN